MQRVRAPAREPGSRRRIARADQRLVRIAAACLAAGYAATLATLGGRFNEILAILVAADAAAGLTLWRLGRSDSPTRGRLAENLGYLTIFSSVLLVTAITAPAWVRQSGAWPWYLAAVAAGCGLIGISGVSPLAVWSGELAFLAGRKPKPHATISILNMNVGAAAEEVMFRSITLSLAGASLVMTSILAALAFVGRHHLPGWAARRSNARTYATEISGAIAFLVLTVLSRSIYPALVAHIINNAPATCVEFQRTRQQGE